MEALDVSELHDFSKTEWLFHSEADRQKWATEVARRRGRGKHAYGKEHCGVIAPPIFELPLKHIIPCNMHALMAILKKLVCITYK